MDRLLDSVAKARIFDLEQLRYAGAPSHPAHQPGFNYFLHRHHARGGAEARTGASGIIVTPEHSGTHIDVLAHQAENLTLHGGVHVDDGVQTSAGFKKLGIETMAPIVARGVLIDLARDGRLGAGHAITAEERERAAEGELRRGDAGPIRSGSSARWY